MPEGAEEPDETLVRKVLMGAVTRMRADRRLKVVDVAAEGLTIFEISRDEHGTPRGRGTPRTWAQFAAEADWSVDERSIRQSVLRESGLPGDDDACEVIVVCTFPEGPRPARVYDWLRAARPDCTALKAGARVRELLAAILAGEPLSERYDLVVLRSEQSTGALRLAPHPLFAAGARPGEEAVVRLRFEGGGPKGTALAVITWRDREPLLLAVYSGRGAAEPYGVRDVRFRLDRPGRVRVADPASLTKDDRDWAELVASVPDGGLRHGGGPAHLICAVEVTGAEDVVAERLSRVRQLVYALTDEPVDVSVIAYGAHSFERRTPDPAVEVAVWRARPDAADSALRRLEEGGSVTNGYPYHPIGVQLEDALAEAERRLGDEAGRVVLLTVGRRGPHPPRSDGSGVLPCPSGHDWRQSVRRLEGRQDLMLAAIHDQPEATGHAVWQHLGQAALGPLEGLDFRDLAAGLGLTATPAVALPFPILDES